MDSDNIYFDESSLVSVSQPQGRPALCLDPLPLTPPILTPCDSNVSGSTRKNQLKHQHQRQPSFACTAPISPSLSQSSVGCSNRPLAPLPQAESVIVTAANVANDNGAEKGAGVGPEDGLDGVDSSVHSGAQLMGFSFSRGLDSRQPSEECESSPCSVFPEPRATITPKNFPVLRLSECRRAEGGNDAHLPQSQGSVLEREFQACLEGYKRSVDWKDDRVDVSNHQLPVTDRDMGEGDVYTGCATRQSMVLPAEMALSTLSGCSTLSEGLTQCMGQSRLSGGKRERSPRVSLLLCTEGVSPQVTGVSKFVAQNEVCKERHDGWEENEVDEKKRPRMDFLTIQRQNEGPLTRTPDVGDTQCHNSSSGKACDGRPSSASEQQGCESLLLVSGPTPTPCKRPLSAVPMTAAGDSASEVLDTREGANDSALEPTCSAPNNAISAVSGAYDTVWPRGGSSGNDMGDSGCKFSLSDMDEGPASNEDSVEDGIVERPSKAEEKVQAMYVHDDLHAETSRCDRFSGSLFPPSFSENFRSFVEEARNEVRRASERLLAKVEEVSRAYGVSTPASCAAAGANDLHEVNQVTEHGSTVPEGGRVARSLQLSLNRTSVLLGGSASTLGPNTQSGSGSRCTSMNSILSDTNSLRQRLATQASSILRRLHGYDLHDAGTLPMIVVVRVVQQVLMIGTSSSPVTNNNDEAADISWCIASPSPTQGSRQLQHHPHSGQRDYSLLSMTSPGGFQRPVSGPISSPSAAHRDLWERTMDRRKALSMEDEAMKMYVGLWRCFHECFGERGAVERLGLQMPEREDGTDALAESGVRSVTPTCFPLLRQQLGCIGSQKEACHRYHPPPLDMVVDYRVFAQSLRELC